MLIEDINQVKLDIAFDKEVVDYINSAKSESGLMDPISCIGCFASKDDPSKTEYSFYIFSISELGGVLSPFEPGSYGITTIKEQAFLVLQVARILSKKLTVKSVKGNWVFEESTL